MVMEARDSPNDGIAKKSCAKCGDSIDYRAQPIQVFLTFYIFVSLWNDSPKLHVYRLLKWLLIMILISVILYGWFVNKNGVLLFFGRLKRMEESQSGPLHFLCQKRQSGLQLCSKKRRGTMQSGQ